VIAGQEPFYHWFDGGMINACHACLDVHMHAGRGGRPAILWEDEQGNARRVSYQELYDMTNRIAAGLTRLGVIKGERVVVYLPMIPEAVATMLAIARLGAVHVVVFSGFGADALRDRIVDVGAKVVVTADRDIRRGKYIHLKDIVDKALMSNVPVDHVLVFKRYEQPCAMHEGRDIFDHELLASVNADIIAPAHVESSHPLFVLYTSGSTGKPKGITHATGGYLTYVYSTLACTFGIQPDSVYWCTADIGWITGHSYVVYGPLMHGATMVMYDGAPDAPTPDAWWRLIERYNVTIFYTAPTALRFFMKLGDALIRKHDLSRLQVLGSVGEPLNPQVWQWYHDVVGGRRCPIIDTWWQTETGGFMIAPQAGKAWNAKPGSVARPLPGIEAAVVDEHGAPAPAGTKGFLVINKPWPAMPLGFFGKEQDAYLKTYWKRFPGFYYSGDYAIKDADGDFWMLGRADEVLSIAGHRIGTAEVESAMLTHAAVAEAAAIGVHDELKGETVVVFVILRDGFHTCDALTKELITCVQERIGKFVTPAGVHVLTKLPKTRSGKIMRRVLKAMVQGTPLGDVTTMEDESVIEEVQSVYRDFAARR
jgi:acetyl-CoA synthetase